MSIGIRYRYRARRGKKWHDITVVGAGSHDVNTTAAMEVRKLGGDPDTMQVVDAWPKVRRIQPPKKAS